MTHKIKLQGLLAFCFILFIYSCGNDDDSPFVDTNTYEGSISINPNNFPSGAGLDLSAGDTGRLAQLDEITNLEWDIQIITYRTSQGGRPGILLYGDDRNLSSATLALNVSDEFGFTTGNLGFANFSTVTQAMQESLRADSEFLFDPQLDVDPQGRADITILEAAYQDLVIGDRIVNLEEANQPVYLVRDRSGNLFKFQMISRSSGGQLNLRWARFSSAAIE